MQHNTTVHYLRLHWQDDLDGEEAQAWGYQEQVWASLSHHIFGRHAQHRINTLELSVDDFDGECLEGVRAGLENTQAPDAYSEPEEACHVTATRFYLEDPIHFYLEGGDQYEPVVYDSADPIEAQVLEHFFTPDNTERRCCVLPGWGRAWVRDQDVISVVLDEVCGQTSLVRGFREIIIQDVLDESLDSVAQLLNAIGHETQTLEIRRHDGIELLDDWSGALMEACRKVEELELGTEVSRVCSASSTVRSTDTVSYGAG